MPGSFRTGPRLPFAAYEDPFATGAARRMTPAELVVYTFEALEAWGREQVIERPPEQTLPILGSSVRNVS